MALLAAEIPLLQEAFAGVQSQSRSSPGPFLRLPAIWVLARQHCGRVSVVCCLAALLGSSWSILPFHGGKSIAATKPRPKLPRLTLQRGRLLPSIKYYRVRPGDSLWRIAARRLGGGQRWRLLWRWNRTVVRNPALIYPGQLLTLRPWRARHATNKATVLVVSLAQQARHASYRRRSVRQIINRPVIPRQQSRVLQAAIPAQILLARPAFSPVPLPVKPDSTGPATAAAIHREETSNHLSPLASFSLPPRSDTPSPLLAAGMSLALPGSGQLFCGDRLKGATFLGIEALALATIGYAAWTKQEPLQYIGTGVLIANHLIAPLEAFAAGSVSQATTSATSN
ncbi:MAG: LysM peptidoglycan-binding domain-containing protein [Cyanobacteria bacterium NC_groundwater_1444_Ag_S-0.65um_54_12]|nr:LysM peptidoglycan-binding domain-containing protein [Cyanobacteria bacterium NC_groundwater_1444_Ag_S-0.65um_54_12]